MIAPSPHLSDGPPPPAAFTDTRGRRWRTDLNVAKVKAVKADAGVDLLDLDSGLPTQLRENPVLLVDALWVVVRDQAEPMGVDDEDFGRGLGGDALDSATTALMQGLIDFFPSSRRPLLLKVLRKTLDLEAAVVRRHEQALDSQSVEALLDAPGDSFTGSPVPPASPSPAPSPGENLPG